jgi:hypothetical protein
VYTGSQEGASSGEERTITLEWFTPCFNLAILEENELLFRIPIKEFTYMNEENRASGKLEITHVLPSEENIKITPGRFDTLYEFKDILPIITKAQGKGQCTGCKKRSNKESQ